MSWYRGKSAKLDPKAMRKLYGRETDLPRTVALETSGKALAEAPENPAVNVVLYNDADLVDERNDYFFDDMQSAIQFCESDYGVLANSWSDFGKWVEA